MTFGCTARSENQKNQKRTGKDSELLVHGAYQKRVSFFD